MSTEGIVVEVEDGIARIEFEDKSLKGVTVGLLTDIAGPHGVKVDTGGTRRTYIVTEAVAFEAGLLDAAPVEVAADAPAEIEVPGGNGSRAEWAAFLDAKEIAYPETATRDELRELWRSEGAGV